MKKGIYIKTGISEFDNFFPLIKSFLEKCALDVVVDGKKIRGYRTPDAKSIWIRDYADMLRGVKYIEEDVQSTIEHFAETQGQNGRIFDYFTTFPEKLPCERENWTKYVRVPVEADVEYRFIKAAFLAWQATGDDGWIRVLLPRMETALEYVLSHPWRWDKEHALVKRAYTIDTWDFAYSAQIYEWLQFQIDSNTFWGIMHGDNSGYLEAFLIMERLYDHFGCSEKALIWKRRAVSLRANMNKLCWNGKFYTHFVKLTPVDIPGVDESSQLSLSNPMDINRGAATHEMAVSIIQEYRGRKKETESFAEWFSIDPPFPDGIFGDEKLKKGAYVNGGIMPLVGGELAKAALDHGYEEYGIDILKRYYSLVSKTGESYLWYFPDGTPASEEASTSPEAMPADGWGSSAMLYAFIEGLAGIEDQDKLFQKVKVSPRWIAAGVEEAEVHAAYASSRSGFKYGYRVEDTQILLSIRAGRSDACFHVLLPKDARVETVVSGNKKIDFVNSHVRESHYVDFHLEVDGEVSIQIKLRA
jgi:hypothetical protein